MNSLRAGGLLIAATVAVFGGAGLLGADPQTRVESPRAVVAGLGLTTERVGRLTPHPTFRCRGSASS